ncbi:MAG: flavodoxin-dependent (E)-4-hydroxy-3-methylbut-2-enyl-diphosphate synthase, partial [Bacteroidota bacterium]
ARQALKIVDAGGEIVRITTQGRREAANLENIRQSLSGHGCSVPLVADVHFNPAAAEEAARHVEKVRINPGNFTGGAKKFRHIAKGSEEDLKGQNQIREKLVPFLQLCRENDTAIRIGTNHGSLSDRMMSLYGDTPEGMVESCMEYLRVCREEDFHNIVLSIKSSNTRIMVHTVRLLVVRMAREDMHYPLHLGVTEAGSGEDGRLKSAVGIGALLADGIGDTIRVSLTEPPENEIPVANKLVAHFKKREGHSPVDETETPHYSPFQYRKRNTHEVLGTGSEKPAVVMTDVRGWTDFGTPEEEPEFVFSDYHQIPELPPSYRQALKIVAQEQLSGQSPSKDVAPLFKADENWDGHNGPVALQMSYKDLTDETIQKMKTISRVLIILESDHVNCTAEMRAFFMKMQNHGLTHPVIVSRTYNEPSVEDFQLQAAADTGLIFLDGYGDGICLSGSYITPETAIATSFGILQASRVRFTRTEFISCPGCGRTLFDLQKTTEEVRQRTGHLKGLKIAVMGCIVNGIGEMADADYGYVGAGPGKVSLFRNRELVRKNVDEEHAVEELVHLIKEFGDWNEPVE